MDNNLIGGEEGDDTRCSHAGGVISRIFFVALFFVWMCFIEVTTLTSTGIDSPIFSVDHCCE